MWVSLTTFDANEKIVIAAAIQLYMLEPMAVSFQREKELKRYQQIMRFALDPGRPPG